VYFYYRPKHPRASPGGFVSADDLAEIPMEPEKAINAPIMVDRFYENTFSHLDGRDIGSRRKHREYMKEKGLTTVDDFTETWAQAEKERQRVRAGDFDRKERRELIGKLEYEVSKNARRR
jgi:hypothetical protein